MPTWVKGRVRGGRSSLPRVEALEERWLLDGNPGPSACGAPVRPAAAMTAEPPQFAESSQAAPAGPTARTGANQCDARAPAAPPGTGTPPPGGGHAGAPGGIAPPIAAGPATGGAPASDDTAPPPPAAPRGGRAAPAEFSLGADVFSASATDTGAVAAASPPLLQGPAGEGSFSGSMAAATASVRAALLVRPSGGDVGTSLPGADDDRGAGGPNSPGAGVLPPAGRGAALPDALAASLPLAQGLLAKGVTVGVGAVERVVQALADSALTAEGGSGAVFYWVGVSSWLVAAALASESARRSWRRRPGLAVSAAALSDLPPEVDP